MAGTGIFSDTLSSRCLMPSVPVFQLSCRLTSPVSSMYGSVFTTWRVLEVIGEESAACDWLAAVESLLPVITVVPTHVFLLLAYLLVEDTGQNLQQILKVTTKLAQADPAQVTGEKLSVYNYMLFLVCGLFMPKF